MKRYRISVTIMAECKSDLIERIEDIRENPIDNYNEKSIREVK
jgi:hypothetical protein